LDSSPADKKLLHKSQKASQITIHQINCHLSSCHGDNLREQLTLGLRAKLKTMAENIKQSRKPNFTAAECSLICDAAEQNLYVIKNKTKTKIWEEITARVNLLGVCLQSVAEVKDKWREWSVRQKRNTERSVTRHVLVYS